MDAAIVTVGDELLTGDTENTNATWLCARLDDRGVDVERVTTLPDRVADIARVVNEYHAEYDAVVVTGGLGPTHDDVTMAGVAAAFGRDVELNDEAVAWLEEEGGYAADDLATGTAELPVGARALHNAEGVAPGAVVESCYVLPGVPGEMKVMFAGVAEEFTGEQTYSETVETSEPESALLDRLSEVQDRFDASVGSYPGETVRLKVTATEPAEARRAADWLAERVESVAA
ncbi:competence/damage-inducible protein A [Halolamina salifodinae]|uniref:Molybdenum cofactor synthesis domain-containing protein n=1 Tax=Halolamina salifodinae TaxID=1202767 RepID=A0A8T4GVY5_9EURY|nr:molybdopterin-binding protein [Halolamina salifodinae]MBP1987281.1 molybdenum cofactor synthesis domain-containing protein [Halolamina salifodinae]